MPRRRATKVVRRRAQPKLPEGDEGKDLSEKERKEKLRVFLADFDLECEFNFYLFISLELKKRLQMIYLK